MRDFWLSCGHHLLDRGDGGGLVVTDEFLKAYFARPELAPPPEACDAERALHVRLLKSPRAAVAARDIAAIADADARENWRVMVDFRDHLLGYPTIEAAYVALIRRGTGRTPPLFINQLVHVILRNALDGCDDPLVLRAAELFFRPQRVTLHEGSLLAADEERIAGANPQPLSPLVAMLGLDKAGHIHVLSDDNADTYWEHSDSFDLALDLTAGRSGLAALARAMAVWVMHVLGVAVDVEPLIEVREAKLTWYVGLDAEGTRIGDLLWNGEMLDAATRERVIGLFRLGFRDPAQALDKLGGEPAYLVLAMTPDNVIRMKPQNLVAGLPIRNRELAS